MVAGGARLHAGPMASTEPITSIVQPSGRRAGATWVAGVGALLLLAGAATFVAVRWERLSPLTKLGLVVALTGAFMAGGRRLARTLPATGDVVFHVGALLVPVDVAAVAVRLHAGWRTVLVAEGVVGLVVLGGIAVATRSIVLAWAGTAGMVVLAAGVAGVTPVPAAPVLAMAAAVSLSSLAWVPSGRRGWTAAGTERAALCWAVLAGLAPAVAALVLGAVERPGRSIGAGTLADLGLAGPARGWSALAAGSMAAALLSTGARKANDLRLAGLALACAGVSGATAVSAAELSPVSQAMLAAAAFLGIELAALAGRRDTFWCRPLARLAELAELVAGVAVLSVPALVLLAPIIVRATDPSPEPALALALALASVGWVVADLRRVPGLAGSGLARALRSGSGWPGGTLPVAATVVGAVLVGTVSGPATAAALVAVAAAAVALSRPAAGWMAALACPWAVLCARDPRAGLAAGAVGAAVLAYASVGRARARQADSTGAASLALAPAAIGLAMAAALALVAGMVSAAELLGPAGSVLAVVAWCWLLGLALDLGDDRLGHVGRASVVVSALGAVAVGLGPGQAVPGLALAVVLLAADAVRLGQTRVATGAALAVQGLVIELARAAGVPGPGTGLALCVAAVAWAGLAAAVEDRWRDPFVVAAAAGLGLGLVLASGDPQTFSSALVVSGSIGVVAGLTTRSAVLGHAGGAAICLGLAGHLTLASVASQEPYFVPVGAQLLVAGGLARRRGRSGGPVSSWIAYGPAILLAGATALIERLAGGEGWHALVAGTVGIAALVAGGWRRLAGPLFLGTALLVTLTLWESLSALAGIPTWAWLSAGGAVLLGAGVALERADTSPVEAGRRLVDVLAERFD